MMRVSSRREPTPITWSAWENEVVDGTFPLRRLLGASSHSAVFLTEHPSQDLADAAIKLIPADLPMAETQLSYWRAAATFSHPHLVSLFDSGRCRLRGRQLLFVAMEYADETLDRVLPRRALTRSEVRDMLPPTLDALAFLHQKGMVHGQLKPANILGVGDRLKLASDCIRPSGASTLSKPRRSPYDAPETHCGRMSSPGDMWSLGITLVEALTQKPPEWIEEEWFETVSLPTTLPRAFQGTVRRCLSRYPHNRPAAAELAREIESQPEVSDGYQQRVHRLF